MVKVLTALGHFPDCLMQSFIFDVDWCNGKVKGQGQGQGIII